MKYVRTKDGRILSLNEFKYEKKYHWYRPNEKYLSRLDIGFRCWHWCFDDEYDLIPEVFGKFMVEKIKREECKFADDIEELCDVFDWKWNETEFPYSTARQHDRYDGYGDLKRAMREEENYGKYLNQDYEIHGAIWTDKGLVYVAKMNDKGELELL